MKNKYVKATTNAFSSLKTKLSTNIVFFSKYHFHNDYPKYIFHHIPKCGGESLKKVFNNWFLLIEDNFSDHYGHLPKIVKFHHIKSYCCLVSHYHLEHAFLWQKYPLIYDDSNKYRIITFIRDPFELIVSKYYYNVNKLIDIKKNRLEDYLVGNYKVSDFYRLDFDNRLIDFVFTNKNYLGRMLGVTENNYKIIIDRYFFIGLLEESQKSLDILADKLNKAKYKLSHINKSMRDEQYINLPEQIVNDFKQKNELDYLIYNYVKTKLNRE